MPWRLLLLLVDKRDMEVVAGMLTNDYPQRLQSSPIWRFYDQLWFERPAEVQKELYSLFTSNPDAARKRDGEIWLPSKDVEYS